MALVQSEQGTGGSGAAQGNPQDRLVWAVNTFGEKLAEIFITPMPVLKVREGGGAWDTHAGCALGGRVWGYSDGSRRRFCPQHACPRHRCSIASAFLLQAMEAIRHPAITELHQSVEEMKVQMSRVIEQRRRERGQPHQQVQQARDLLDTLLDAGMTDLELFEARRR